MIELRGMTKMYGANFAVRNLSFKCERNEFVVIFGPAGAGKSTTLKTVAGIIQPTYGELYFQDKPLNNIPPEKRNFSMAFENYVLYSHLTNYENLAFPLRAKKLPEAEIKRLVANMAELLHIEELLDRKPGFLSGGQRQRIALGRCLIRQADMYLLDEPISHLDARLRIQMRAELKEICSKKEATVLHVTHEYREAMTLADRVLVLNKGRLMQDAPPEVVYNMPANEFVAQFVGDPPMSFFHGSIVSENGRLGFRLAGSDVIVPLASDFDGNLLAGTETVRLGMRANRTSISGMGDAEHNVPGTIYLVESQGSRKLVTIQCGKDLIQVVTPPEQDWTVGENCWISAQPEFLHIFEQEKAIYHPVHTVSSGREKVCLQ